MTLTLSPPVKIAALLGILGALLLGGSMMTLGRGETSEAIPHAINPHPFGAKKSRPRLPRRRRQSPPSRSPQPPSRR